VEEYVVTVSFFRLTFCAGYDSRLCQLSILASRPVLLLLLACGIAAVVLMLNYFRM